MKKLLSIQSSKLALALLLGTTLAGGSAFGAIPESDSDLIKVDGSSTVYPITEAVAEEFGNANKAVKVTVGISGTGGGFKKFCAGETEISNASRPIKATEQEACQKSKIEYIELPVAYDALTVVVNPKNTWANSMTVQELKTLWAPEAQGKITKWSQVRAGWPEHPIKLFGPGVDSGTFDYFTEAVVGKEDSSRGDYTSSEDDNVLVQGVANDMYALGFFGQSYYMENQNKLKAVQIDDQNDSNGKGPQSPTTQNVIGGTYVPLSRPLFVYVRGDALSRPVVKEFVTFYLKQAKGLVSEVGYVPLPDSVYRLATSRFEGKVFGSAMAGKSTLAGLSLEQIFSAQH